MERETNQSNSSIAVKMGRSYYDILGVSTTASNVEINEAYERLAYGQKQLDDRDMELYHEATKAYQTLMDPNKRRQYDLAGEIEEGEEYDGLDVKTLGGIGRMFGAVISRLGVPLQTTVSDDTLMTAKEICQNGTLVGGGSCLDRRVEDLVWGWSMDGRVDRQVAKFYRITIDQHHVDNGFIVFCRSLSGKFKLIIFDAEGSVLHIEESLKSRDKSQTETALYFTNSFSTYHLGAPMPNVVQEKDTPPVFSRLGSFVKSNLSISAGQYLLCVYGDNFIGRTDFSILAVPTSNSCSEAKEVQSLDAAVLKKKEELSKFEVEYLEAREKFEQVTRRLKHEAAVVEDLVDRREFAYSSFLVASADAFLPSAIPHENLESSYRFSTQRTPSDAFKNIIPSGETIAHMTSTATSTATAAGGWMSSRLSMGLNKLMVASGAMSLPTDATDTESKSIFDNVDVIDMDNTTSDEVTSSGVGGLSDVELAKTIKNPYERLEKDEIQESFEKMNDAQNQKNVDSENPENLRNSDDESSADMN